MLKTNCAERMYYFCPMQRNFFLRGKLHVLVILSVVLATGCSPTRHLKEGEYFFTGYKIKSDNRFIDKDEYASYIRQKPNRKFFFVFRLQMGFYNFGCLGDTTVEGTKFLNHLWKITKRGMRIIGEEPVVLDTVLTHRSTRQLALLMNRRGYFNALVRDSIIYEKKRARIIYSIRSDVPYKINKVEFFSEDTAVYRRLIEQRNKSLLQYGVNYDEDLLDRERDRFVAEMKTVGYYFFTKQFITYTADTALNTHQVNLVMNVSRLNENILSSSGNSISENHHKYHLNRIFIQTDYEPMTTAAPQLDTMSYKNYLFLSAKEDVTKRFRRDFLLSKIFISQGDMFNINDVKNTYSRLTDLSVFRFVNMKFEEVLRDSAQQNYLLDVYILLTPLASQDFSVEAEGTHNAGNLGVAGNLVYRNKNVLKGAELLEVKLKGGFEFQKSFSSSKNRTALIFNTFEIGPEVNLNLKKLLLLNHVFTHAERQWNPGAKISASANYQQRPDYTRSVTNFLLSEQLKTTPQWRWTVDWIDINSVNVVLSESFRNKLNEINDKGLTYSYDDHLITTFRISTLYTDRDVPNRMGFEFLQMYFETSGNALDGLSRIHNFPMNFETDSASGLKRVYGVTYSQGLKGEIDFRHYQNFAVNSSLVWRINIGAGVPYGNSISLPFEKSFYGGGSNDIRAWQFRTLGPGSYSNPFDIEQTGEFKFEGNLELRSLLVKYVEGAAFADAGNIWLLKKDTQRQNGELSSSRFLSEVALGAGLGIRFNFTYFILRLDGAVKLHDPALAESQRWVYSSQKFSVKDINYNVGIGYPF